jgi:hypothetical protein
MNSRKSTFLSFLCLAFASVHFSSVALAWARNDPPEAWFQCKADSECFDIAYPCAGGTVNKKFKEDAGKHYALENARTNCVSVPSKNQPSNTQKFRTFCENGKCAKEGVNPKMGFS